VRTATPPLKLLVIAFLLNHFVLNKKLWMMEWYLYGEFPPQVGQKNRAFPTQKVEKWFLARSPHASGAYWAHRRNFPFHGCCLLCKITCFFIFLGVCFHIRCLGTWEQNSSHCNVFHDLLNLHLWSSQSLQRTSNVLLCWFVWFLLKLHQSTLELICFGKNLNCMTQYRKQYKCPYNHIKFFEDSSILDEN